MHYFFRDHVIELFNHKVQMASGGFQPNKQGKPEPKRRSNWQRSVSSDRDDTQSLNSLPSDIRINNWDLSDLWPTNLGGDTKRRKKSKGNPEREREQSLSVDSPPHDHRQQTPSSYPRTKLAPGTPTSQRLALENLKQHMTFSDMDDQVSTDGERNNERQASLSHRRQLIHTDPENDVRALHYNRNNNMDYSNRDQEPDSNEVMGRLMQIRDFMKQARSMLDSMERLGDRKKMEDIEKVRRLIRNLQEQEQGYRGLLQNSLQMQEDTRAGGGRAQAQARPGIQVETKDDSDDDTSVDLEVKSENSETSDNSQESRPRIESKLGMESGDEVDQREKRLLQCPEPPLGAAKAPATALAMAGANTSDNATMRRSPDLDNTLMSATLRVPMQESEDGARAPADTDSPSLQHHELLKILKEKQQQLQALMGRQEELNLKRRETEKKLLQAQARDNKARAALSAVTAGRQFVEKRLASHQAQSLLDAVTATSAAQAAATASAVSAALETASWSRPGAQDGEEDENQDDNDDEEENDGDDEDRGASGESRILKSNIVGYPESDDEDNSNVRELGAVSSLPNDLQELKRQLNFLRNEFSMVSEAPKNVDTNTGSSSDDGRQQLQNKLQELQSKRTGINKLLQELQMIHSQPLERLQNNDSSNSQNFRPGSSNIPSRQLRQQREPLPPPPPPPPQISQNQQKEEQLSVYPLLANLPLSRTVGGSGLPPNLRASMNDMAAPTSLAVDSAMATFARLATEGSNQQASTSIDPLMVSEVQEKLRRLKEVRGQLDQLRSLVQYYQDQRDELEPVVQSTSTQEGQTKEVVSRQSNSEKRKTRALQEQDRENEPPSQLEVFMQSQQQQRKPQGRQTEEPGALGGAGSFQNMAQLLNLAGGDQGDDHSDEENASVSQSESQWSHLGPWDDDPEIQEKVKKLKAAKEKLRQLQDLVAFVQQSPDAAHVLPDNLGDIANSTEEGEGEAVSQATQTDEPNASVSEGEILSDSNQLMQQRDNTDGLDNTRAELERLRKERAMLLEIQSQLKQIQDQTEGTSVNRGQGERRERPEEQSGELNKPGQTSNAPVVTFASNDELYSKMRRQRILREELRSKKKELEAIMKKDRNKRQYSRNQDNQSDTISLNTDTFGITASVDATMATWGGSTVDNLENITEDEDGQERNERPDREDDEEDDGYPSDGIVQVEEEEEENDSDNGTYTIEADARQRRNLRKVPSEASGGMGIGARPKTSRGRKSYPQPSYGDKNVKKFPRKQKTSKRPKGNQREYRLRQENFRSAEELIEEDESTKVQDSEWFQEIQERLRTLSSSVEILLRKSDNDSRQLSVSLSQENAPQSGNFFSPMHEQMMQLQNQSMMLSYGQVVQSLARQQGDMHQIQQQLQSMQLQMNEWQEHSFHGGLGSSGAHLFRPTLTNTPLNNSSFNLQASAAATGHSLSFNQQIPSPFTQAGLNNTAPAGFLGGLSPGLRSIQQQVPGMGLSTGNLSNAGVGSTGLSVNTQSSSLNPPHHLLTSTSGFVFNPMSHSTLGSHHNHSQQHQNNTSQHSLSYNQLQSASQQGLNTASHDLSPMVNSLQHLSSPGLNNSMPDHINRGAHNQQSGIDGNSFDFSSVFPTSSSFLSTRCVKEEQGEAQGENPVPSHLSNNVWNKKRNYGLQTKKTEKDPCAGSRMSTARAEHTDGGGSSTNAPPLWSLNGGSVNRLGSDYTGASGDASAYAGFDANSSFSSIQSIREEHSKLRTQQTRAKSVNEPDDNNTLFDTLRDTIYTEVASLISQNESRPHFLLELFRDIRQVDSDLMRQRTLYALEDLLKSGLKEPNAAWVKAETANSEQTPSESITSEDEEDLKVTRLQEEITAAERSRLERLAKGSGTMRGYPFDYAEAAENPSSLSTPTNGADEAPFFQDALGETVIRFDHLRSQNENRASSSKGKAKKLGASASSEEGKKKKRLGEGGFLASEQLLRDMRYQVASDSARDRAVEDNEGEGRSRWRQRFGASSLRGASANVLVSQESQSSEVASSSAMDQASESSMSDMPYPRIDMKQLDRQIKAIMLETIPVVKEHMEDVCSGQLLAYIKRLVLSLTGQMGNQDFARFFHRQLASILEDTLQKYHGRKMRECGEDLLVEISDVLFNELAFFRLMQDLDDPNGAGRLRGTDWQDQETENKEGSEYSADSSSSSCDEDNNDEPMKTQGHRKSQKKKRDFEKEEVTNRGFLITEADQDEMGRERDDELASQVRVDDADEKDDDETEHSYKIELAPSETKPFTRIGSDEDDDDGDEEQSMEDPSETAVSRDSMLETNVNSSERQQQQLPSEQTGAAQPPLSSPKFVGSLPEAAENHACRPNIAGESTRPETEGSQGDGAEKQDREKPVGGDGTSSSSATSHKINGECTPIVGDGAASGINGDMNHSGNNGENDNDTELTVEDLPDRLDVGAADASVVVNNGDNNSS